MPHFPWNRWICPRDKTIRFDDDGYPYDPAGQYAAHLQPDCVPLRALLGTRCGVLLGEAGIGKSEAMTVLESVLRADGNGTVVRLDLGEYSDTGALAADLFDAQTFRDWVQGGHQLHVVLDSLDEGIAGVKNIVGLLQRRLRNVPFDRLHLYVSCRTTAWPETLTKHLISVFGEEALGIYQLVPLTSEDVRLAARTIRVDDTRFITEVNDRRAQALACNPLTLQLLLNVFLTSGFPASNLELLERGLIALCEPTPLERDHGHAPPYTAAQLLAVASRIAALAMLSGRATIDTSVDDGTPRSGVPLADCLGGEEGEGNTRINVDEHVVRAALRTGLFNARGAERFGFAHKTYGEFLTARFLAQLRMPLEQLEAVLCLPDRTPPEYVPQLHEVVAWLASFDGRLIDRLVATEPEILLASDLPADNAVTRSRIVEAILARTQAGVLSYDRRRELWPQLRVLQHVGLGAQLAPTLRNRALSDATREMALTIAESCNTQDVAGAAADIALDTTESRNLRIDAGYAVWRLNEAGASARLKPLAFLASADDPLDELRGLSLRACWPNQMTASELFDALRPPQRRLFGGSYSGFLYAQNIADELAPDDLTHALAWVGRQPLDRSFTDPFTRIAGAIVTRTLHDDRQDLIAQLAPIIYQAYHDFRCPSFIAKREDTFGEPNDTVAVNALLLDRQEMRRRLIEMTVNDQPPNVPIYVLAHSECPLVREDDFEWLLERACNTNGDLALQWARLARRVMSWQSTSHLDRWLDVVDRCAAVAAILDFPRVIQLDSADARRLREEYQEEQRDNRGRDQRQIQPAAQAARIERTLNEALTGRPEQFIQLAAELHRDLNSGRITHVPTDLRTTRGWQEAPPEISVRIVDAAEHYLVGADVPRSEPLETLSRWSLADEAPALALLLLIHERPAAVNAIPEGTWQRWAGHILARLIGFFEAPDAHKDAIAGVLHQHAATQCQALILAILDDERAANEVWSLVRLWEHRLDDSLAPEVFERLRNQPLPMSSFKTLLAWLLRRNPDLVAPFVLEVLQDLNDSRQLPTAVVAAHQHPARFWPTIWPLTQANRQWGRTFLEGLLDRGEDGGQLLSALTPDDLANLLDFVLSEYVIRDDVENEAGIMTAEDHLRIFRSVLVERLRQAGTREAYTAIVRVREAHPEHPWLGEVALQAKDAERRASWNPPAPAVLRRLFADRRARFVTSTSQLLAVLRESLDRLAETLHGELPARANLWDEVQRGVYRPKDEEHLSDTVARHLRADLIDRGIVANREVQIRRREFDNGQAGQRTDIRVDVAVPATVSGDASILTAIIEVKGCWHAEVETAMQTQLVDRYLRDNQCQTGLYLVGWYRSGAWDATDRRQQQTPWVTIEAATTAVEAQAAQLTTADGTRQIRAYVLDCALR